MFVDGEQHVAAGRQDVGFRIAEHFAIDGFDREPAFEPFDVEPGEVAAPARGVIDDAEGGGVHRLIISGTNAYGGRSRRTGERSRLAINESVLALALPFRLGVALALTMVLRCCVALALRRLGRCMAIALRLRGRGSLGVAIGRLVPHVLRLG